MLRKALIAQIIVLIIQISIGALLLSHLDQIIKLVHGTVGMVVLIASVFVVYAAFRERMTPLITSLATVSGILTVLAFIGGRLTATHYDQGMIMMRASAIIALIISIACLCIVWKIGKTKTLQK